MVTVAKVAAVMQRVRGERAEAAARATGCVRRVRRFSGATFVQTVVFGWLAHPAATVDQLCQVAAARGVRITPQGLRARFTEATAATLQRLVETSVTEILASEPAALPLLDRLAAVVVQDSTLIALPDALAGVWDGCGGGNAAATGTQAALKLQVGLDLRGGQLQGPTLHAGRQHDQLGAPATARWPPATLLLRDLGYFCLDSLAEQSVASQYWVTRPKVNTVIRTAAGTVTTSAAVVAAATAPTLDLAIALGAAHRLPCRLVAVRLPPTARGPRGGAQAWAHGQSGTAGGSRLVHRRHQRRAGARDGGGGAGAGAGALAG